MPYVVGDLGYAPCPPPGGCPEGTRQNPSYPAHSATCCKQIPGYTPTTPATVTPTLPPAPEGPAGGSAGGAGIGPWLQQYKWYMVGGVVLLTGIAVAFTFLRKPAPATSYIPGYDEEEEED